MMTQMIFVNLPVADVPRAEAFYAAIGCVKDPRFSNEQAVAMQLSDTIVFMLLRRDFFQTFTAKTIADTATTTEVLIALSRESREAVDEIVARAVAAGGRGDIRPPEDHGFMYGRTFEDPDGHIFEPAWMNVAAFPGADAAA